MLNKLTTTSPISFIRKIEVAARKGMDGEGSLPPTHPPTSSSSRWGKWRRKGKVEEAKDELGVVEEEEEEGWRQRSVEWERLITVV